MKFDYTRDGDDFVISVPLLRLDLLGRHDLVEEVGRVLGYDRVAPQLPHIPFTPRINETMYRVLAARQKMIGDGYREVMTYSLVKKGVVEIARAPKGKEAMRSNLSDGLKSAFELNRLNAPYLEQSEIKIFEIGDVYPREGEEVTHVAWADKKGIQEMTLEEFTKDISIDESYGAVLPKAYSLQLAADSFAPWSSFPFIYRDISLWSPEGTASEDIQKTIRENAGDLVVKGPTLIDSFSKDGKTSYAFRLVFQSMDRTLTDNEVTEAMERVTTALVEKGFEIR
jgi:phenylalanyl-tRNA synthetase beta subunit